MINKSETADEKYKLLLTKEDREFLISLIEKKPISEEIQPKLLNAYNYFKNQIEEQRIDPKELYDAIEKLQIVVITLDREQDDPQVIFESLNSTGKELSQSDLIRNYVLMGMDKDTQKRLYDNFWLPFEELFGHDNQGEFMDNFFRDYLTMKTTRIPKIGDVYDEFKDWTSKCEFRRNECLCHEDLCNDLYNFAKIYTDIKFSKSGDNKLDSLFNEIRVLNMNVANPFLLRVIHDYQKKNLAPYDSLIEIIKLCISYVLRRSICEIPTNSLNKTFATLVHEIKEADYLNSVKSFFINSLYSKKFPNDEEFTGAFIRKEIYKSRNKNYILERLENYDNKSPIVIENLTIEHIMPQSANLCADWKNNLGDKWKEVQDTYLHTIGNLTLTGYNTEMSDKPFMEKMNMKGGFKQTGLRLNEYIKEQKTWNEEKIKERAIKLSEIALKIWAYPQLTSK